MKNLKLSSPFDSNVNSTFNLIFNRLRMGVLATLVTLFSGISTAEDVEIYTGVIQSSDGSTATIDSNPDFFPNVLFILDNSTSMGETEPVLDRIVSLVVTDEDDDDDDVDVGCDVDVSDYNSAIDYSFGSVTNDDNIYIYIGDNFTGTIVSPEQNQCQAYRDLIENEDVDPVLTSSLIQWGFAGTEEVRTGNGNNRSTEFLDLFDWDGDLDNFSTNDNDAVECSADQGIHGHDTQNTGDTNARNRRQNRFDTDVGEHYFNNRNAGDNPYSGVAPVDWVSGNFHRFTQLRIGASTLPSTCPALTAAAQSSSSGPFDSTQTLGTINNPEAALTTDSICGGSRADRNASTGRSELSTNDVLEFFKNRYFKIPVTGNSNIVNVYRCQTRLEIMKEALTSTLQSQTRLNAGLMRFNRNSGSQPGGGTVINAVLPMNLTENKSRLITSINELEFGQATPLAESLYEAYLYLNGNNIDNGRTTLGSHNSNHATFDVNFEEFVNRNRTQFQTDPAARTSPTGSRYSSPMNTQCQPTSIVLLSDGEPTNDNDRNTQISSLTRDLIGRDCSFCSDEMSRFLRDTDVAPSAAVNRGVNTFTIGLNLSSDTLEDIARNGQPPAASDIPNSTAPGYFEAADVSGLETAFRSILGQIQTTEADVFSAPAVTVNAFNRLQSREDIYYALFRPEPGPRWGGNVKRYRVNSDGEIVDANNDIAIEESNGFFTELSQSFWSENADGSRIEAGGAGSRIAFSRRMFGNVNGTDVSLSEPVTTASGLIATTVNRFLNQTVRLDENPINIGAKSSTLSTLEENEAEIAAWVLGLEVESTVIESNSYIGDNLHGTPYVLSFGTSIDQPDDVVFFTSNQGLLHAIDGETGNELWSYVPDTSLFENIGAYYNNEGFDKIYGLDSEITFKVTRDPLTDQEIDGVQLFFGQRRGGNKVISVDVTNARSTSEQPVSRRWVIQGGTGDFADLGQTWAEPIVTDVNYCDSNNGCGSDGVRRSVLFISGGYDEYYDDQANDLDSVVSGTVSGNALYMVDSETGELLWMAGATVVDSDRDLLVPDMIHSIVARPTVIDSDSNGFADTIFVSDIAGQVFRFDFRTSELDNDDISSDGNNGAKSVSISGTQVDIDNVSGGMIASLEESNANRRFFNPLDATLLPEERDANGDQIAAARYVLTTGSGYRAHPLDAETFGNRIFVIYDDNLLLPQSDEDLNPASDNDDIPEPVYTYAGSATSPDIIELVDLPTLNIVGGLSDSGTPTLSGVPPVSGLGYTVTLPNAGEKLLSSALISNFRLLTTSYTPSTNNAGNLAENCQAGLGNSIIYSLDLRTGNLIADTLANPGISPSPVIVFVFREGEESSDSSTADGASDEDVLRPIVVIGTEPKLGEDLGLTDVNLGRADKKVWWENGRAQ